MSEPILALVRELVREFEQDPQGRNVARRVRAYALGSEDWRAHVRFDPQTYTRNLVTRNEHFEMLVLCWSPGQRSPIHDHAGQHCFMGVLEGEIEEIQYAFPAPGGGAPLRRGSVRSFTRGDVAYIHDRIALHRVQPAGGRPAVSLHVYARPIDVCRVFDEATGTELERQLTYHSPAH